MRRPIIKLYLIEDRIRDLSPEQKQQQRQRLSKPRLDHFPQWLMANQNRISRDSHTCHSLIETAKANGLKPLS